MEWNFTLNSNVTSVNVTDLKKGTEYVFTIVSVTSDGQRSPPSVAFIAHTIGDPGNMEHFQCLQV